MKNSPRADRYRYIAIARQQKMLTQQELSEVSGISLRTIQRIESGAVDPRPFSLRKLHEVLEIDPPTQLEDQSSENRLRIFTLIQWSSVLLPVFFAFISYYYWRKNNWQVPVRSALGKLVSVSLLAAILIPLLSVILMVVLRNFGIPVAFGNIPAVLLLYIFLGVIYAIWSSFLISHIRRSRFSRLSGIPDLFFQYHARRTSDV